MPDYYKRRFLRPEGPLDNIESYNKLVNWRLKSAGFLVIAFNLILVWRMFEIQIIGHDRYLDLAQDQQRFEKIEIAQRGKIYVGNSKVDDSRYYPLAFDVKKFAVWVVPKNVRQKEKTASKLGPLLAMSEKEIFDKINNDKVYIPPVKKGLTLDEANKVKAEKLSGVLVVPEYSRYYPEGTLASHVLGFVNAEGEGNYGFEGHYNNELKGLEGKVEGEKDTLGRVINLLNQQNPKDGISYVLSLDRSVQYFVEKKLEEAVNKFQADSGSVVIMDVKTGGIVAMASWPNYDPNNFREVAETSPAVFVNPVIAHLYEPGSVFKPVIMAAALDQGVVTKETREVFNNYTVVDGYEIHTAENKAFGEEDMSAVLQNSDNVAMVWISDKLGKEKEYSYINDFGFFDKTRLDLDTEVVGYAPPLKQWRDINRATISFGQGITITPIELVAAYAAIANKGVYIYPHIVDKMILPDGSEKKKEKEEGKKVVAEPAAVAVSGMLTQTVDKGHAWRAGVPGFAVAAKTGTAQIPKAEGGYEESEDGLGIFNHSLAGFAPAEDPRFAMLVKLEKPKTNRYAEDTSAVLFGEVSSYLLNYYYRVAPTREIRPLKYGGY